VSVLVTLSLTTLVTAQCFADAVVLRDGTRHEGRLANRAFYLDGKVPVDFVAIMTEPADPHDATFLRIPTREVDYILVGDGPHAEILDPLALAAREGRSMSWAEAERFRDPSREDLEETPSQVAGVILFILGITAAGVGVFHKFGEPEVVLTEAPISRFDSPTEVDQDKSYNSVNYMLMITGSALAIGGIVTLSRARSVGDETGLMGADDVTQVGLTFRF